MNNPACISSTACFRQLSSRQAGTHSYHHPRSRGAHRTEFIRPPPMRNSHSSVVDGKVDAGNEQATLLLTNGQQATVEPGQAPAARRFHRQQSFAMIRFYYPAVLDLNDLPLTLRNKTTCPTRSPLIAPAICWRLSLYPADRSNPSASESLYHATCSYPWAKLKVRAVLSSLSSNTDQTARLAIALRQLIAAVKRQPSVCTPAPN